MTINVLCVDDDYSHRRFIQLYFQSFLPSNADVQKVDIAEDYYSALEKIKGTKYDLVISDSLRGKDHLVDCFTLHDDIKGIPNTVFVILADNDYARKKASELGIPFYEKTEGIESLDTIIATYVPLKDNI
jgi:CheY-like chemotaxis protein